MKFRLIEEKIVYPYSVKSLQDLSVGDIVKEFDSSDDIHPNKFIVDYIDLEENKIKCLDGRIIKYDTDEKTNFPRFQVCGNIKRLKR